MDIYVLGGTAYFFVLKKKKKAKNKSFTCIEKSGGFRH